MLLDTAFVGQRPEDALGFFVENDLCERAADLVRHLLPLSSNQVSRRSESNLNEIVTVRPTGRPAPRCNFLREVLAGESYDVWEAESGRRAAQQLKNIASLGQFAGAKLGAAEQFGAQAWLAKPIQPDELQPDELQPDELPAAGARVMAGSKQSPDS